MYTCRCIYIFICVSRFNPQRVVEQFRVRGVLETIRISSAGFLSRCAYSQFCERYNYNASLL